MIPIGYLDKRVFLPPHARHEPHDGAIRTRMRPELEEHGHRWRWDRSSRDKHLQ